MRKDITSSLPNTAELQTVSVDSLFLGAITESWFFAALLDQEQQSSMNVGFHPGAPGVMNPKSVHRVRWLGCHLDVLGAASSVSIKFQHQRFTQSNDVFCQR